MMKKLLTSLSILVFAFVTSAQEINSYKYIIIPKTYEFTGEVDEYRLNSLTKFLFEKNGFNTLMKTEEKPEDLAKDRCLGLNAKLENNSGVFVTKLVLKLLDCDDKVVYESREGRSREKEFESAYQEALKDAMTSFEEMGYSYQESTSTEKESEPPLVIVPSVKEQFSKKADLEKSKEPEVEKSVNEASNAVDEGDSTSEALQEKESQMVYRNSGKSYLLKKTEQGLGLYQEDSNEPIAILIKTNNGESYLYNSLTNQGIGYFDLEGNLVIEYYSSKDEQKVMLTYNLAD